MSWISSECFYPEVRRTRLEFYQATHGSRVRLERKDIMTRTELGDDVIIIFLEEILCRDECLVKNRAGVIREIILYSASYADFDALQRRGGGDRFWALRM